jgi:uncharacterized membrane protein
MPSPVESIAKPEIRPHLTPPAFPTTPGEFITVLAHYHRAEIARMAGWRDRIDRTTNWAITVVAALLSVSLSTPTAHHGVLIFAMLLVLLLLSIESRRYRFFDVYRRRVRSLERNYFAEIFSPGRSRPDSSEWVRILGDDLRRPSFLIPRREAFARRLRRNYGWMFLILLLAWLVKTVAAKPLPGGEIGLVHSPQEWVANAALGPLPGYLVIAIVALFYGWILYVAAVKPVPEGELAHGDVHV